MQKVITFDSKGHDTFIDFIKAYAILWVLIGHTITHHNWIAYGVWGGMQVPLFILVQAFHSYKKDTTQLNWSRLMHRIILPFLVVTILTFGVIVTARLISGHPINDIIIAGIKNGGYGPGSYFPWIFVQVAFLLPIFARFFKKMSKGWSVLIIIFICEGLEILCSLVNMPEFLYRLLAIRYLFLLYLGWQWVKEGIQINTKMIVLSILSLATIVYFEYFSANDEPWFFNTGFTTHRWPCYFFVANGFTALLYAFWSWLKSNNLISKWVKLLAASSYEIFLIQMAFLSLWNFIDASLPIDPHLKLMLRFVLCWTISIGLGISLNRFLSKKRIAKTH